ncbi:MAG: hypothetical protein SFY68_08725 [Candidatus Sumerlaeia bacterium]|nr:hypothetical protein [Candidatus Sumerlaeia bacterium]
MRRLVLLSSVLFGITPFVTGCIFVNSRAGVGMPPAVIYKNTTTPAYYNPAYSRPAENKIPFAELSTTKVRTYRVGLNIPGLLPPGASSALTVGWGDMSLKKALEEAQFPDVAYVDARETEILGIFNRLDLILYHRGDGAEPLRMIGGPPGSQPASQPTTGSQPAGPPLFPSQRP